MNRKSPLKWILIFSVFSGIFVASESKAQKINAEYERYSLTGDKYLHSGMAMSPDQQYVAIASNQSYPLYIVDYVNRKVVRQFDVGNWYAGSRVSWSAKGKFILLQQLFYHDFSGNKDREVNFEIVDAGSGRSVLKLAKYHDVKISPDEQTAIALTGNTIEIRSLSTGKTERSFSVGDATNSLAISPDGKTIAVSEKPNDKFLGSDPQFRKNKKGLKYVKKYKQVVSFYNFSDLKLIRTANEYYDNVYRLDWSDDGRYVFCLNIPHLKATTATSGRQNFISVLDGVNFQSTRTVFPSNSNYEPDFRLSHNGKYMGIVSWGKFPELRVHDFETGQVLQRFEMSTRVMEGISKLEFPSDGRVFIEFLPDNKSILATFGNQMLQWNIPQE
ncbi:MAG: WD40 repeat domain-containing protein [Lentimicrobium sp.]